VKGRRLEDKGTTTTDAPNDPPSEPFHHRGQRCAYEEFELTDEPRQRLGWEPAM
jgi:hypothetical protein